MLKLEAKLYALERIYGLYDRFVEDLEIVCEPHCSACCTCNVTLTTLEGYWIADHLVRAEKLDLLDRIARHRNGKRFQPKMTTNMLAERCAGGKEIPEEEIDPGWGSCALLEEDLCTIYSFRPFGCRCLLSRIDCRETGAADIDTFVLSVNTLFLQIIEHVDADGYSGNLMDVLPLMALDSHRKDYADGSLNLSGGPLIRNRPMGKLFVPPEHRARMQPILQSLREIRV